MRSFRKFLALSLILIILILVFSYWQTRFQSQKNPLSPLLPPTEKILFRFAVLSDIHSDLPNLKKAINLAKNGNTNFVIITGDLTTVGKQKELLEVKETLDQMAVKYYVIPGNHDLWTGRRIKRLLFNEIFGPDFQTFASQNIKFILVNNSDVLGINSVEESWLREQIKDCLRLYCLVFMHMPLNHPTSSHIMGEDSPAVASQAAGLVRLLVESKAKEVFTGHLHYGSSYELDGLKTTVVGAISQDRNPQLPRFLEVSVKSLPFELNRREVVLPD